MPKKKPQYLHLKPYQYQPGTSGNPAGKPAKSRSAAYTKKLGQIDPETGESYAAGIAASMICAAIKGDVSAIMNCLSNDTSNQIKKAVDELVKRDVCTPSEAKVALSLFTVGGK